MNHKEYIDKHKKGKLSDTEWENFAEAMINAKFDTERKQKYARMMESEGIYREKKQAKRVSMKAILSIAASVLILLLAGWLVWQPSQAESQQLAAQYLETPFNLKEGGTRGLASVEKNRGKALEAYNNQQYEKSIEYLQNIEIQEEAKAADYFQMGLCLIYQENPNYKNALQLFDRVKNIDDLSFRDERIWFSALCWMMLEEDNKAKQLLKQVAESPSNRKSDAAKKLLKELKN